jgi:lysophospholipase
VIAPDDGSFAGVGGVPIRWQSWTPESPRAILLLAHGYGEHVGRYGHVVEHFVERGFAVVGLDHRGHGRSGGTRGHCRDFREMTGDLRTLADVAGGRWPGLRSVLLGHSMGGLISVLFLAEHPDTVVAAAVTAPALRVPAAAPSWVMRAVAGVGRVFPRLPLKTSVDEHALSHDPAVGPAYLADPLVHRHATAGFFRAFGAAGTRAFADAHLVRTPLLVLQGDADRVVVPAGAGELDARLGCPHELVMLPGYYHEILNEPPPERACALGAIDSWFARWLG